MYYGVQIPHVCTYVHVSVEGSCVLCLPVCVCPGVHVLYVRNAIEADF